MKDETMFKRLTVNEFERTLLFRHGRYVRLLDPGVHWVRGETVTVDVRRRDTQVDAAPVHTLDLVPVGVRLQIAYRVADPEAAVLRSFDYRGHLVNDATSAVHRSLSTVSMAGLSVLRRPLEDEIHDRLSLEAKGYGVRVEDTAILQVRFPKVLRKKLKRMEV
jgi:regulator of protease activity HflC (stomatin/prohibitin superfamily)